MPSLFLLAPPTILFRIPLQSSRERQNVPPFAVTRNPYRLTLIFTVTPSSFGLLSSLDDRLDIVLVHIESRHWSSHRLLLLRW